MPEEGFLTLQLHELLMYLAQMGAATMMVVAQHGFLGSMQAPLDVSYLADAVMLFRHFEATGRLRKAISMVKKRSGAHEPMIRELTIGSAGVVVGQPLEHFRGVMTGLPTQLMLEEKV
jgi:circadian clock protein KaiC